MLEKSKPSLTGCAVKFETPRSPWRRVRLSVLLTLVLGTAGGCLSTSQTPISETDLPSADFCQTARAIYYSRHDTPPTIEQIKEHNAVGAALKCGWLPAKKQKGP